MPPKTRNPASACGAETGPGVFCLAAEDNRVTTPTNRNLQHHEAGASIAVVHDGFVLAIVGDRAAARCFLREARL
jgi:hypothetical protein